MKTLRQQAIRDRAVHRGKQSFFAVFRWIFLLGFCFTILYPLVIMLSRAFMGEADLFDNGVILLPRNPGFSTFARAIERMEYWKSLGITTGLSLGVSVTQTMVCMMVGYGFARFRFRGQSLLFALVVMTIVIPPQLIMVPLYMHFRFFDVAGLIELMTGSPANLLDTVVPFFLLSLGGQGLKNGIFIYMFRQVFRGVPKETEEAALVDGSNAFGIFFRIMIPAVVTMIVTVGLFSFVWQYNDSTYANLFLKNTRVLSMTYGTLANSVWDNTPGIAAYLKTDEYIAARKSTGVLLMLTPILLIYGVAQRFFVEGIERSGIVG